MQGLCAAELVELPRRRVEAVGGLALEDERELARKVVRRARRLERLQEALRQLLAAGEEQRGEAWRRAAAMAEDALRAGRVGAAGRR